MLKTQKKNNYSFCSSTIDLFKLISSILVLFLHANSTATSPFFNMLNFSVTPIAVPFFFIISGFFFHHGLTKAKDKRHYFLAYEKKLLILYLIWSIVSLPISIITYSQLYTGRSFIYVFLVIVRRYVLCGEGVFWYILAMAESAVVLYLLSKFKKLLICILIVTGLFLGFLYDNNSLITIPVVSKFNHYFYVIFSWSNNFIMKGIPFMGIGYLISEYILVIPKKIYLLSALIFIASTALNILFYFINVRIVFIFIIQSVAMSLFAMFFKTSIDKNMSIIMRELSSSVYFLHTFILYYLIEAIFGAECFIPVKVIITLILCIIIFSIVKLILQKKKLWILCTMFNIKCK